MLCGVVVSDSVFGAVRFGFLDDSTDYIVLKYGGAASTTP